MITKNIYIKNNKMTKVLSPKIGDLYVATNGLLAKIYFFKVKSLTKTGNPRLEEFKCVQGEGTNSPNQSDYIIFPDWSKKIGQKTARYSKEYESWRVKFGEMHYYLYYFDPNKEYHKCRYY